MLVDFVWGSTKQNSKQERETVMAWDSGEFSKTEKKTMEGVAERKQQRKIFGGKKETKIRCMCC